MKTLHKSSPQREGGRILASIVRELTKLVEPGITTLQLEHQARKLITQHGVQSSFLGYNDYSAVLCTSLDNQVIHAMPSQTPLEQGQILTIDCGIKHQGYHVDMAVTVPVGEVEPEVGRLIRVCKKALKRGIKKARAGVTTGDIGNTIQRLVESSGFSVVEGLCGHGIGKDLHQAPDIPNTGQRHKGSELELGQTICIEPMIAVGAGVVTELPDKSFVTSDDTLSAHFEHTVLIGQDRAEVLTR